MDNLILTGYGWTEYAVAASESQQQKVLPLMKSVSDSALPDELDAAVCRYVRRVFDKYGRNLSRIAQALKVARNTVKKYLPLVLLCGLSAFAGRTIRSKSDMRLWQTVHDRAAPLTWSWEEGADSATLTFSNHVSRTTSTVEVARGMVGADHRAARGSLGALGDRALPGGETLVDVTLVQKAGANEVARETATLAYVDGAGGGPITVRAAMDTPERELAKLQTPRVYAFDTAWLGESGDSGYTVAWPLYIGLKIFLR